MKNCVMQAQHVSFQRSFNQYTRILLIFINFHCVKRSWFIVEYVRYDTHS
jgi:hypothetical protein